MLLQPKNWAVFQHYKDRCPPWIKLHRDLLNDRVFMCLPLASKALAPLLWLLASESKDGVFDGSLDELVFRLHITPKDYQDGVKPLIDKGFFVVASGVLAECYQDAIPETEGETETKKEKKVAVAPIVLPDWIPLDTWQAFLDMRKKIRKPPTEAAIKLLIAKLERFRKSGQDVQAILEKSITNSWQDVFEIKDNKSFAQQAADIARTTVPAVNKGQDPVLVKIEADRKLAAPMPAHIRQQINSVLRKV
jgi:hypothetical protein